MGTRSNFPELGSELLGDEPQPEADMSTQDVARTGFGAGGGGGVTHLVGLAQCTISKSEVQGPVLGSSCPPLKGTRVCAGDRRAKEGAGSVCEFKAWSLVKARCTTGTPLQGASYFIPSPLRNVSSPQQNQNSRISELQGSFS